jgi:hypothetical protein
MWRPVRLYGAPMLKAFTEEAIADERIKALARKVSVAIDPEFADILDESPSRVTVTLGDGRTVQRRYYVCDLAWDIPVSERAMSRSIIAGPARQEARHRRAA